jgi:hypothetical protein
VIMECPRSYIKVILIKINVNLILTTVEGKQVGFDSNFYGKKFISTAKRKIKLKPDLLLMLTFARKSISTK